MTPKSSIMWIVRRERLFSLYTGFTMTSKIGSLEGSDPWAITAVAWPKYPDTRIFTRIQASKVIHTALPQRSPHKIAKQTNYKMGSTACKSHNWDPILVVWTLPAMSYILLQNKQLGCMAYSIDTVLHFLQFSHLLHVSCVQTSKALITYQSSL